MPAWSSLVRSSGDVVGSSSSAIAEVAAGAGGLPGPEAGGGDVVVGLGVGFVAKESRTSSRSSRSSSSGSGARVGSGRGWVVIVGDVLAVVSGGERWKGEDGL